MLRNALTAIALLLLCSTALATPTRLAQQGRLLDDAGSPLSGPHELTFALYEDATGGSSVWSEVHSVDLTEGYYAVTLGSLEVLDDILFDGGALWLQLSIDGTALDPRQEVVSVPYALRATSATHLDGGLVEASQVLVGGVDVIDGTGNWTGPPPLISWNDLTDRPGDLTDGDQDSLSTMACQPNESLIIDPATNQWSCAPAPVDSLAALNCQPGETIVVDPSTAQWACINNDRDGDGVINDADCAPDDSSISPIAVEICDNQDNNCNGLVDEEGAPGAPTWYADMDGDGFAGSLVIRKSCETPPGFQAADTDCDDTDPQSSNTANEICDGLDNDCNGLADYVATEGDGGSEDQDTDGDGSIDCADCADDDSSTFPGAPELCGDGIDNDCDPSTAAEVGDGTSAACAGSTCAQLLADGHASDDGVYWIDPPANPGDSLQVRCDMTTDGGGWTLVGVAIYANSGGAGWNDEGDLNLVSSTDLNAHWHLSSDRMNALATSGEYRALCFDSNNNYSRYWWGVTDYNWGGLTTASESWDTYDRTGASYATAWSSGHYGLVSGSTEAVVVITAHNGNHWACAGSAGPGGEGFTGRGGVSNMRIWAK